VIPVARVDGRDLRGPLVKLADVPLVTVWTPLIPATMPVEQVKSFGQQAPIGRAAQPVEIAPAFVFLASQESSYVAGETIGVTGGTPLP
jgi:NAD(P)-dependent dehydrogenase (short-subunit alcohol dehydrogenase family)